MRAILTGAICQVVCVDRVERCHNQQGSSVRVAGLFRLVTVTRQIISEKADLDSESSLLIRIVAAFGI